MVSTKPHETIPAAPAHSRHERRALKAFGRTSGGTVITGLVPHDAALPADASAAVKRAVDRWRAGASRSCFSCALPYRPRDAGAVLIAASRKTADVAISGMCLSCWDTFSADEVETAAANLLRLACPSGDFLDNLPDTKKPPSPR